MNLEVVSRGVTKLLGSRALIVKAHSPEILMGVGIAGTIGSAVLACRATLKCHEVIEEYKYDIDAIHACVGLEEYSDHDHKKDLTMVYTKTGVKFLTLYGPSIALGTASIACIIGGHGLLRKRNVALMAAYKVIDEGFKSYRQRVIEEYGEEQDYMFRHGLRAEIVKDIEIEETKDGGLKTKHVKKTKYRVDPNASSIYARFFDETCSQWSTTPEYNLMFVKAQQNYYNDMLKARGHVFLNEVYDALGIPRTAAGSVVGWMIGKGDDYIDFGIYDGETQVKRDFVNGYERSILLDFNVDGVIYDMI